MFGCLGSFLGGFLVFSCVVCLVGFRSFHGWMGRWMDGYFLGWVAEWLVSLWVGLQVCCWLARGPLIHI